VSVAYSVLGLLLVVIGVPAIALGLWITITARRPPWVARRTTIPAGRERVWGASVLVTAAGAVALGVSDLHGLPFSGLRIVGIVGLLTGVALTLVVIWPRLSR
jgi:hypothetical protein